jgi:hypothetical protein
MGFGKRGFDPRFHPAQSIANSLEDRVAVVARQICKFDIDRQTGEIARRSATAMLPLAIQA